MKKIVFLLIFLLFLSFMPLSLSYIHPVGIAGYITDTGGAPISGATVTITNNDTSVSTTTITDSDGLYVCSLFASHDDLLELVATYDNSTGINSVNTDITLLTQWINATISMGGLHADFTYSPSKPTVDETISFRDNSIGDPDTWLWSFGDTSTAVGRNPTHSYSEPGTYIVTLTITSGAESSIASKNIRVYDDSGIVIPPLQPPNNPEGYTVEECYSIIDANKLKKNHASLTIVIMDSGVYPQIYNNTDLSRVRIMHHPSFENGYDFFGHGTFVTYEIAHLVYQKLPYAEIISYRIFDDYGETTSTIFSESIDAVKKLNPDIVSISAGAFGTPKDVFSQKTSELTSMGVLVVSAGGNYGPTKSTIISPACSPNILGVGASDPMFTVDVLTDDIVCIWSSRGPVAGVPVKPNIVAPGESIIGPWRNVEQVLSGTSLSTPLVAGASAVIYGEHKGLSDIVDIIYFWDGSIIPKTLMGSIEESAVMGKDIDSWGYGIPQFQDASNIFFIKLFILLLIPIIIILIIIIIILIYFKKQKEK